MGALICVFLTAYFCLFQESENSLSIANNSFVCNLIGVKANSIGISGADLGVWAVRTENNHSYLLSFFGDVISPYSLQGGSSALLKSEIPLRNCSGINWITDNDMGFYEPLVSLRVEGDESTVPSGAVQIGNDFYLFAQRITKWGEDFDPLTTQGYGVLFKSSQLGFFEVLNWESQELHLNTAPVLGKLSDNDSAVFMMVTGDYRKSEIYLSYVLPENIESKADYNYLTGYDNLDNPLWTSNISLAQPLLSGEIKAGEVSYIYNSALDKYFLFFQNYKIGNGGFKLYYSDKAYGPFELIGTVNPCLQNWMPEDWHGCYGGYLVPESFGDGSEMFYSLSVWHPYTTVLMKLELNGV